jgi:hypothetical protein
VIGISLGPACRAGKFHPMLGIEDLTEKIKSWKPDYKKVSWPLKSCYKVPIAKFLDYFGIRTKAVKQNEILNRVQFSNNPKCLYALEMGFFEKSNSFFTVCRYRQY